MRLQVKTRFLVTLSAGALLTGVIASAPASGTETLGQDAPPSTITVSGSAVNPDGTPGANLPVSIKAPQKNPAPAGPDGNSPDLLVQEGRQGKAKGEGILRTLARGTTDEQGKFSLKFEAPGQGDQTVTLEIGEATRTPWAKQQVVTKGKDKDVGKVQLRDPVKGE